LSACIICTCARSSTYGVLSVRAERALAGAASATEAKDRVRKVAVVFIVGDVLKMESLCRRA
jgi:hypothetical protein